jgi:hypothetical protein
LIDNAAGPRRRKVTAQNIAAIRDALDFAHDLLPADHHEAGQVIYDEAGHALDRIATALFGKKNP